MSERTSFRSSAEESIGEAARDAAPDAFAEAWRVWHDDVDRRRRDPRGILALTGLRWLAAEPARIPGVPGLWSATDTEVRVEAAAADGLVHDGTPLVGHLVLGRPGVYTVTYPGGEVELAVRGSHVIARPRNETSPFLDAFEGTPAYAPDPGWVLHGTLRRQADETAEVDSATGRFRHRVDAVGTITLDVHGDPHTLLATPAFAPGTARLTFRDETSGRTTAPQGRTVIVEVPDGDGPVVVDLNRATNLPCAYSDFGTCALPAAGNTLRAAVTAGEKAPTLRVVAGPDGAPVVVHRGGATGAHVAV